MSTLHAQPHVETAPPALPFPRILCAVDGSRFADQAVAQALTLAGSDAELTFLTVTDGRGFGPVPATSPERRRAEEALENASAAAHDAGLQAVALVRHGHDSRRVILDEARSFDLLVLGTHGHHRSAGYLLGGTAVSALHHSPVPVLIARPPRAGTEFPRDILVATDGSPAMGPTIVLTAALARRHDARIVLLHVDHGAPGVRHELAEEATALLKATGREPVTLQLEGHAPSRIAEVALELPAALVITGSRALTGFRALGSLSERTGIVAPCSVLVVRRTT